MRAQVGRLERTDGAVLSTFERNDGSFEGVALAWRAMMDAGTLDRRDGEVLILAIGRWHKERVWDLGR